MPGKISHVPWLLFIFTILQRQIFNRTPVCFNVRVGVREKLKAVPDWKERLREFVDQLISDLPENE
ncbi:MAG: hypothetical protein HC862_08520 [Scytonema sp. RU_4_4]|nr:hypothetical protein [Scytonema sp. RU_4_4]